MCDSSVNLFPYVSVKSTDFRPTLPREDFIFGTYTLPVHQYRVPPHRRFRTLVTGFPILVYPCALTETSQVVRGSVPVVWDVRRQGWVRTTECGGY